MPADTPSPHRFLAPTAAAAQRSKPKPQSGLRNVVAAQIPKVLVPTRQTPDLQFKKLTPARRFVIAPTRHTKDLETPVKSKAKDDETWPDAHTQATPRPKPRRKFERVESIQESSQLSPIATQERGHEEGVLLSTEREGTPKDDDDEMLFEAPAQHKRRRLSSPDSPSNRPKTTPSTPISLQNSSTHRFKAPPPRTPAPFASIATTLSSNTTPIPGATPTPHRPHFILPPQPTSPPKPAKPLPEIFSPSRKNGKYIPDGLASTMTRWIIEIANTGFAAQERSASGGVIWGRERDDGVKLRVRIGDASTGVVSADGGSDEVECFPGGVVFVRGDTEPGLYNASRAGSVVGDDVETRVLLAGQGGARGSGGVRVKRGGVVGVRAPMWEVDVGGEMWVVGVDWVVL